MSYYEDATSQLRLILNDNGNRQIISLYKHEIEKSFCGIYIINYISKRIEFREIFSSDFFNVSFSCLIESFSLIINNYPRGASLVLRSGLENFIKFIIAASNNDAQINDRSYTGNKGTLDRIIKARYADTLMLEGLRLNSKMETEYSKLSALSHSLTPESISSAIDYFSDINIVNENYVDLVFERMLRVINQMFSFCIIICQPSFKVWDSSDLERIFRMAFGQRKTQTFLRLVKI